MTLKEAEKLSPVTVVYERDCKYHGDYNGRFITINTANDETTQIVVLLHEIGHALDKNKDNRVLREYRAFKYAMKHVVSDPILEDRFVSLVTELLSYENWPDHQRAVRRLMKLRRWKKLCKSERKIKMKYPEIVAQARKVAKECDLPVIVYETTKGVFNRRCYKATTEPRFSYLLRDNPRPVIRLLTVYPNGIVAQ